jgi:hypothetical protein
MKSIVNWIIIICAGLFVSCYDTNNVNSPLQISENSSEELYYPEFMYEIDVEVIDAEIIIKNFKNELKNILEKNGLSDNEYKLGLALYDVFENHKEIFLSTSNNKFNKNLILLSLREMTNLSTKEIRTSLKKYKKIYYSVLQTTLK